MFSIYIAITIAFYNILAAFRAKWSKKNSESQSSLLTIRFDRKSIFVLFIILFVFVLYIVVFYDQYSVSDKDVHIISSDLSYLTDISLAGTYSLEQSADYLKTPIHYFDSLSVHLFKRLTHLPCMYIMRHNFFFFVLLPPLLLLFIVSILTDGNKWAILLSLMILLFDTGITTSLVGLFGNAPHLFNREHLLYASTMNFHYISNTTSLMARYLIYTILFLVIVVYRYLPQKISRSSIVILLYLSVLTASSYVTKFSLYFPLMVLLATLLLLDLLRWRKNINIIVLFSLSLGLSLPYLFRMFVNKLPNRMVFSPGWYLEKSKQIILSQFDFFHTIPEPYLDWTILLILLSSAWYLLLPIVYSFKDWLKKNSLFSSFLIASIAGVLIPFLFVDSKYPFHLNVFLFSQTGYQIFAIFIPVWFFSQTKGLRTRVIRGILIIPLVLSFFYGFQQFIQFREKNYMTLTRAQLADTMTTYPDRMTLYSDGEEKKYRVKDRMDVDYFLYVGLNRPTFKEKEIHEFTPANSRWIKTRKGRPGIDHIFILQKKGDRSSPKKRNSTSFSIKPNTHYRIETDVTKFSRITFNLQIAFFGKEGQIGSQTLYFSPDFDTIHHYFQTPSGTQYLKFEVTFKSLKYKRYLKKSMRHLMDTSQHIQHIERIKIFALSQRIF
jgi:hypothetical protein